MKKGYSYYLFALVGIFISPLCCIIFSCYIPERGSLDPKDGATDETPASRVEEIHQTA